jgi:hypothetical protein
MTARTIPLTFRWLLLIQGGGPFVGFGRVQKLQDAAADTTGSYISVAGIIIGLARPPLSPRRCEAHWSRDFGNLFGLFSIGGWRLPGRTVPISTGWMRGGEVENTHRIGVSLTVASRTLFVDRVMSGREYREYLALPVWRTGKKLGKRSRKNTAS